MCLLCERAKSRSVFSPTRLQTLSKVMLFGAVICFGIFILLFGLVLFFFLNPVVPVVVLAAGTLLIAYAVRELFRLGRDRAMRRKEESGRG